MTRSTAMEGRVMLTICAMVFAATVHCGNCPNGLRQTGDINRDGVVDALDMLAVGFYWGPQPKYVPVTTPFGGIVYVENPGNAADCAVRWRPRWINGPDGMLIDVGRWVEGNGVVSAEDFATVVADWTIPESD